MNKMPLWAQVMVFGALLSAILSTASGTPLAPTSLFTENVLKPLYVNCSSKMGGQLFLFKLRVILVAFTMIALLFALNSKSTQYETVQKAYNVTLADAFVPRVASAYSKRTTTQEALLAAIGGPAMWLGVSNLAPATLVSANLLGLTASAVLMVIGSLMPQVINNGGAPIPKHVLD